MVCHTVKYRINFRNKQRIFINLLNKFYSQAILYPLQDDVEKIVSFYIWEVSAKEGVTTSKWLALSEKADAHRSNWEVYYLGWLENILNTQKTTILLVIKDSIN